MEFSFVPMTPDYAKEIVATWRYEGIYAMYNYDQEKELMNNYRRYGEGLFAVLNELGELVGELNIEFFDQNDNYIENYLVLNNPHLQVEMWIGFGLRPDLTGKGLGAMFVSACIDYAIAHNDYQGQNIKLAVAEVNQRGRKVYERIGFKVYKSFRTKIAGKRQKVIWMVKDLRA